MAFREYLKHRTPGLWWHWLSNLWLIVDPDGELTAPQQGVLHDDLRSRESVRFLCGLFGGAGGRLVGGNPPPPSGNRALCLFPLCPKVRTITWTLSAARVFRLWFDLQGVGHRFIG
jgi:hypothetical protein